MVNASLRRAKGRARERRIRERLGPESQSNYGGGRALARLGRHRRRWHCFGTHRRRALASRCAGPGSAARRYTHRFEAMKRCICGCVSPPLECPLLASRELEAAQAVSFAVCIKTTPVLRCARARRGSVSLTCRNMCHTRRLLPPLDWFHFLRTPTGEGALGSGGGGAQRAARARNRG